MEVRNDADLQAIQTSVAFKNISDAVEQYRRQFGLAFLALIAFSAIHVGLVVIANLYTMQTRIVGQTMTVAGDEAAAVGTAQVIERRSLSYVMTNLAEEDQIDSLRSMKSVSFVDQEDNFRQYTVTGFQLGGWKRSELKLYTSVGHVLEYVRGKGVRVFSEHSSTGSNSTGNDSRKLLTSWTLSAPPPSPPPPPYSSIKKQMIIDCNVIASLNGGNTCSDDDYSSGMTYDTFTGIDSAMGETGSWAHNKALYDQYQWIQQLESTTSEMELYTGDDKVVTMDVVTGETTSINWGDSLSSSTKYSSLVSGTGGAANTLFGGSDNAGTSAKVTSNLADLEGFAGGLSSFVQGDIFDNTAICDANMDCNHSKILSAVSSHLAQDSNLNNINEDTDAIKTMFQWNAEYAAYEQSLPSLKVAYNYGSGAQTYLSSDEHGMTKAEKGLGSSYWTGAYDSWMEGADAAHSSGSRMYDTYVVNDDDSDVSTFTNAQEKAFTKTLAENSWGETIWGTDMTSAYTAGYPGTGKIAYSQLEAMGDTAILKAGILDAIGDFAKSTEVIEQIWTNYKAGFSGLSYSQAGSAADSYSGVGVIWSNSASNQNNWCGWSSCSGTIYGCSGSGIDDLDAFNSPIFYWAYSKCGDIKEAEGDPGKESLLGIDGVSNAIGGVFFSETLGGFESYAVYLPPKFCHIMAGSGEGFDMDDAKLAMDDGGNQMEYVFMLHGWGGHCDFIDGLAMVMDDVFSSCSISELTSGSCKRLASNPDTSESSVFAAMNGFVVFAPEDGSTPFGTKTWYQDNEFTGKHQDFLQSELVNTADVLLQVEKRTIGLFGFSQGGVGSILMSLGSSVYSGIASFNGPLMPAECFFKNKCHQECGVDFIMCELLWTSVLVAMVPYVTVKKNYMMQSTGTTDPMDQGTCEYIHAHNHARCMKGTYSSSTVQIMWQYIFMKSLGGGSRKMGPFRYCPQWRAQISGNMCSLGVTGSKMSSHYYYPEYYPAGGATSYFYLKPYYFNMAVQHFMPTHNIMTNAAIQANYEKFLGRTPFFRLWENPNSYTGSGFDLSLLISIDVDDEFGLITPTRAFGWLLMCEGSILAGFDGVWAYDNPLSADQEGHAYNYHDTVLTLQWFSEVFRSFAFPDGITSAVEALYTTKGAAKPDFDEFGVSSSYSLMTTMEYTTCYLFQLNVGTTGQYSGEVIDRSMKTDDGGDKSIAQTTAECSKANDKGKVMLYPALSFSDGALSTDDVEFIKESNEHSGFHGDLDGYKTRHDSDADTDAFSCYMGVASDEYWSGGDSFIVKVFDCNMSEKKHGGNGGSFSDSDEAQGDGCSYASLFPIVYDAKKASTENERSEAYAECSSAFPTY